VKHRLLLLLILFIAALLRFHRLGTVPPGLYRDEAMDGSNALEVLETGHFQVFYPEDGGREGLYIDLAAPLIRVWGNETWVLRLPAAIFGVLTVLGVYYLVGELATEQIALLATFFLATSFWHINFSRIAFRAIGAPCMLTWALFFLAVGIRRWRQNRPYLAATLFAGAVYGLGFYTYIAYRATPVLIVLFLLYHARKASKLHLAFAAASLLTILPLALYFIGHTGTLTGRSVQVSVLHVPHPGWEVLRNIWRTGRMFFTRGDTNWRHNIAWRAELFWPVAILLVLGIARGRTLRAFALWWLAIAAVPVVLSAEAVPHALRAILMIPPVAMLAAEGAVYVNSWISARVPQKLMQVLSAAFLLLLACEPFYTYFYRWATDPHVPPAFDDGATAVALQINALPRDGLKYVITEDFVAAQPVMFLTATYTPKQQQESNIHYVFADSCAQFTTPQPAARIFCLARR